MKNKLKYVVSLLNSSNECVLSHVVSSRSAVEAVVSFVLTSSALNCSSVYSLFVNGKFTVSVCPYVDSDSFGGD